MPIKYINETLTHFFNSDGRKVPSNDLVIKPSRFLVAYIVKNESESCSKYGNSFWDYAFPNRSGIQQNNVISKFVTAQCS